MAICRILIWILVSIRIESLFRAFYSNGEKKNHEQKKNHQINARSDENWIQIVLVLKMAMQLYDVYMFHIDFHMRFKNKKTQSATVEKFHTMKSTYTRLSAQTQSQFQVQSKVAPTIDSKNV